MTEDVKPEVIRKTQELLGKYFKKPPLTEKLLKKPPFRFLHDVVSSVIRETGFLDGLFSDIELNSENIKDKDSKLVYLTKLIDVVKLITGSNLTVRPSKIIAGHEPTKTNELLQLIGKALDKKVSSTEAIEHYKSSSSSSRSRASGKTKVAGKEDLKKPAPKQTSQSRKPTEKEKLQNDQKKRSASMSKVPAKDTRARTEVGKEKHRDQEKENKAKNAEAEKDTQAMEVPPAEPMDEKRPPSVRQRHKRSASVQRKEGPPSPKTLESPKIKSALLDSTNSPTHKARSQQENDARETELSTDRIPDSELRRSGELNLKSTAEEADGSGKNSYSENKSKRSADKSGSFTDSNSKQKSKAKEPGSLLSPGRKSSNSEMAYSKLEKQHTFENPGSPPPKSLAISEDATAIVKVPESTIVRPRTSLRPPTARPISARPAAPRMRSKAEFIFNEDITTPLGNVNVIVENFDTKEEDDVDNIVVMETGINGDSLNIDSLPRAESQLSEEHGHLVAQILETQRELVNSNNVDVMPKKIEIEWEAGSRRNRESTIKEVDRLRGSIQTLTRATNPLGKLLDYLQEDVEMMQRELQEWRSQYNQLSEQLQQEQVLTQESIEPMKGTLKDIEGNIKIQLDRICQVKAGIMKNDQKIQRLLNGHL